jgi:hypothetical protein
MVTGPWSGHSSSTERRSFPSIAIVQGKPVVRRGRKARDLPRETARPPVTVDLAHNHKVGAVKANLARFTFAITLLATMAMSLGAGIKWFWD